MLASNLDGRSIRRFVEATDLSYFFLSMKPFHRIHELHEAHRSRA
jgi:hypothetical protein